MRKSYRVFASLPSIVVFILPLSFAAPAVTKSRAEPHGEIRIVLDFYNVRVCLT